MKKIIILVVVIAAIITSCQSNDPNSSNATQKQIENYFISHRWVSLENIYTSNSSYYAIKGDTLGFGTISGKLYAKWYSILDRDLFTYKVESVSTTTDEVGALMYVAVIPGDVSDSFAAYPNGTSAILKRIDNNNILSGQWRLIK